jgi:hypothetical protein
MDFEKLGSALAKAVKGTKAKIAEERMKGTPMYRTNMRDAPKVEGLQRKDGWVDMQVQFLIDKKSAGADHVVGWTVLKPGASHAPDPKTNPSPRATIPRQDARSAGP